MVAEMAVALIGAFALGWVLKTIVVIETGIVSMFTSRRFVWVWREDQCDE